jgi:hypothetical protein
MHHRWESLDGVESHSFIVWPGGGSSPPEFDWVHDFIGDACVRNRAAWSFQRSPMREVFEGWFGTRRSQVRLSMVIVTPSRLPSGQWHTAGRPSILQQPEPGMVLGRASRHVPVSLGGTVPRIAVATDRFAWAARTLLDARRLFVHGKVLRVVGPYLFQLNRLFEVGDDRADDVLHALSGRVPAVEESLSRVADRWRTRSPMIHFLRLDGQGVIDLLLLETSRDSGELAQIRWGRQSLESFLMHDPYYAAALCATLTHGRFRPRP